MTALEKWSTACLDWDTRIVEGASLIPMPPLFASAAEVGLEVFDNLRMVDAANSPYMGEVSRPWIREFVAHIFGSYDAETGVRHIQEYFMLISKKNGKSTNAAGIMLTALILNWRESAEFIILSPTIEIANNSFKPAADMVRADPELSKLLMVQTHTRTITHRVTGATLKVVAADSDTVGGKKAVGVLIDELWLFGKKANADSMIREAIGGLASRPEGFVIYLSTQSDEPPEGVFKTKLDYARGVRDGEIDDNRFLPVLYEFPPGMLENEEHLNPDNFYVTNPNITYPNNPELGGSVDVTFLLRQYAQAQNDGEGQLKTFLAKHLNVQIGLNLRADRWPGAAYWLAAKNATRVTLDYIIDKCEVIAVGIDGGGLDDLLGLSVLGREIGTGRWLLWSYAWAHPSVLERRKDIVAKLQDFAKAKEMTLVTRIGDDMAELGAIVERLEKTGLLFQVGLDPASVGAILTTLLLAGVPEDKIVSVSQGWRLAGPIRTMERKVAEGILKHDGSSMMNWCVGNAKVVIKGNAILITKQLSGTAKIDPLMAAFNAVFLMSLDPPAQNDAYNFENMVMG